MGYPTWNNSDTYNFGALTVEGTIIYRSIQNGNNNNQPSLTLGLWWDIAFPIFNAGATYNAYDLIQYYNGVDPLVYWATEDNGPGNPPGSPFETWEAFDNNSNYGVDVELPQQGIENLGIDGQILDNLFVNVTSNTGNPINPTITISGSGNPEVDGVYNYGPDFNIYIPEAYNLTVEVSAVNHISQTFPVNHLGDNQILEFDVELEFALGEFECSKEYFDEAGNSLGDRISDSQNTIARYRFRDVSGATPDANLYGYIFHLQQVQEIGENSYFPAFSEYDGWQDIPNNPVQPLDGESGVKVEVIGDSIYISVRILYERLPGGYVPRTSCRIIYKTS